jgi:hypothetical protein
MELLEQLDRLNYHKAWVGEHHSGGFEIIACPEMFLAAAAQYRAHGALGEPHTEFGLDAACEINTTPAHHTVLGQIRAFANHLGHKLRLVG